MFFTSIIMGRALGPEGIGALGVVSTWVFYAGLVKSGLASAAFRDMPHFLGRGEAARAKHLQNVALTGESLFVLLPASVLFLAGWVYTEPMLRYGLWVSAVVFVVTVLQSVLTGWLYVYQRFDLVARIRLITGIGTPVGILVALPWLHFYSALIVPGVVGGLILLFLFVHRDVFDYCPTWDTKTAQEMIKVGIPLVVLTFISWAYFMSDRPAILAAGVSLTMIGYYYFASNLIRGVAQVFWDFTGVLQPVLWQEIGRRDSVQDVSLDLIKIWVPYMMITAFVASLGQAGFGAVVHWVAPQFVPSVEVFEVLVFILVFYTSTVLPNLVLVSKLVNRHNLNTAIWGTGLVINVSILYACARLGYGLLTIAAMSMLVDLVIAFVGYAAIHRYLFHEWRQALPFYAWMIGVMLLSVALYFCFQFVSVKYRNVGDVSSVLVWRTLLAVSAWATLGGLWWRWRGVNASQSHL